MYDRSTESLWSQIIGEAVVGDRTGSKLNIYPSQVMTLSEIERKFPEAKVLSKDTGFTRIYGYYPYGDYDENNEFIFPVSQTDDRLSPKEIMFIVNYKDKSVAFKSLDLKPGIVAKITVEGDLLTAKNLDGEIIVETPTGQVLPGYNAMWFSWIIHNKDKGFVWTIDKTFNTKE